MSWKGGLGTASPRHKKQEHIIKLKCNTKLDDENQALESFDSQTFSVESSRSEGNSSENKNKNVNQENYKDKGWGIQNNVRT